MRIHEKISRSIGSSSWPSRLAVVLIGLAALSEVRDLGYWQRTRVLNYDVEAYYHYLPATIIHHGLCDLSYVETLDLTLHPNEEQSRYGILTHGSGCDVIKYTYGTAFFELPLFLIAHAYMLIADPEHADGYSPPYQLAVSISTILFVVLGFVLLRSFLRKQVPDLVAAIAMIAIGLGTNLFFYTTHDSGMSHGYLFFLYAAVLFLTDRWYAQPQWSTAALLGLVLGMILIIRPVDAIIVLVPIFWPSGTTNKRSAWFHFLIKYRSHLSLALLFGALPIIPQLFYWKAMTGSFLFYSYENEGFAFLSPEILNGLFSYKKGWLVYSPLVALGAIGILLMTLDRKQRPLAIPLLVFFPVMIFVVFSWEQWWYGGGFGCRPMVPSLALLTLPIAILLAKSFDRSRFLGFLLVFVIACGIRLNLFQQMQYERTILHWDSMTKERYWEIFGVPTWDGLPPFP